MLKTTQKLFFPGQFKRTRQQVLSGGHSSSQTHSTAIASANHYNSTSKKETKPVVVDLNESGDDEDKTPVCRA